MRTLAGLIAVLGLVFALAVPAMAAHEIVINDYDETAHECGEDGGFKIEGAWIEEGEHTYILKVGGAEVFRATLDATFDEDGEVDAITVISTDPPVAYVVVKTGDGVFPIEEFDPEAGKAISHISFCGEPEEEPTPTPTPTPAEETETPSPSPTPEEEETPSPTPLGEEPTASPSEAPTPEGVAGGTPTPAPGGSLPDTAAAEWTGVPATALSLLLLASLGALLYLRLAQDPARKR